MKIQWLNSAFDEFLAGINYIAQFSPNAAERMKIKIVRSIALLASNPYLGKVYDLDENFRTFLVHKRYKIFYHIENENTDIAIMVIDAFWHTARDNWLPS